MPSPMNSWSLLYEELLKMKDNYEHSDFYYDYDRNKPVTGVASTSSDFIDFWGNDDGFSLNNLDENLDSFDLGEYSLNDNTVTFGADSDFVPEDSLDLNINNNNGFWKYSEDVILKEVRDYLSGTYRAHYCSQESKTQTLDLIDSIGDAEAFCRSNAIKYLSRFGKKNGKSKFDILKAIHYCILLYHFSGITRNESNPYETF